MRSKLLTTIVLVTSCTVPAWAQNVPERTASVPLYRVTVIDRTVSAVDYQYRNGPTMIDFRGTVLLPTAKGSALVESKQGRVEVDARFEHLAPPSRFGSEYLTYVLWAITPQGHAKNLGEVLAGSSDKAHLRVTTDLQTFGLIVTAEPYSAVRLPSDVVVIENELRPDTMGARVPIQAKYELLPRGHYVYEVRNGPSAAEQYAPKLSANEYQQVVELYEAQNAVAIARAAGADRYASDTYAKAAELLREAQQAHAGKEGMTAVVTIARHAAQTAEDARILATERKQRNELAAARDRAARAEALKSQAEAQAATARTQAAAAQALLEQERAARRAAERTAAAPPPTPPPQVVRIQPKAEPDTRKSELRMRVYQQLNAIGPARDTPRGLVVTLADSDFHQASANARASQTVAGVAAILRQYPGLAVAVEGHGPYSEERAYAVRDLLERDGAGAVTARGLGDTRPLVSNATATGREQNRRVEVVIYGDQIGQMPYWTKAYSLTPSR